MARMRTRHVHCSKCNGNCAITVNMDDGRIDMRATHTPKECHHAKKCIDNYSMGVFDRQFGERIIKPLVKQ